MEYYKFLTEDNKGSNSGFDFTKYLPVDDNPGPWLPKIENLLMCESGYHACKRADVFAWLNAQMFVVELRGKKLKGGEKDCAQEMRFIKKLNANDKTYRLFACWCAAQVLPIFEKDYPDDKRPRNAIEVAKKFANGKATKDELAAASAAARDAARAAARDAARDAARAAARAAARDAARAAAWAAARAAASAAARDAAWDAARDAAWAAARKTQLRKFFEMVQ